MMEKQKVIIITIITFFILASPGRVFAFAAPLEDAYWCNDFRSSRSYDSEISTITIEWDRGVISLREQEGGFSRSGALWTGEIRFRQNIYSLVLSGLFSAPSGTNIMGFIKFDNDSREYPLAWNSVYYPDVAARKFRLKIFLSTDNVNVSPSIEKVCISAKIQDLSERGIVDRDRGRVSDLKSVNNVIQKYYDDFGRYPIVNIKKNNKKDQWRLLEDILDSASLGLSSRGKYTRGFRSQQAGVDDDYKYGYLTNGSGSQFLLWIKLEKEDSNYFDQSYGGVDFRINCSSPVYCISSKAGEEIISTPTLQHFINEKTIDEIQDAEFIRQKNDSKVYLKLGGHRVWLRTPKIFENAGGLWDKVNVFSSKIVEPLLKFIKKANESAVYLVSPSGLKRPMINERMLASYGNFSEVITVEDSVIDLLPENYLIRAVGGTKVYFLDQRIKRWIISPQVFERLGFDFSEIVNVDPAELDFYPEADPIF